MSELEELIREQKRDMRFGNRVHQHNTVSLDKAFDNGGSLVDVLGNDGKLHLGKPRTREKLFFQSCPIHGATEMVVYGSSSTSLQCKACNRSYQHRYYHEGGGKEYQRWYYSQPAAKERQRLRERARREAKDPDLIRRRLERMERRILKRLEALAEVTRREATKHLCRNGHDTRGNLTPAGRCRPCRAEAERKRRAKKRGDGRRKKPITIGRPKGSTKRYCKRGHDTARCGRYKSGSCVKCTKHPNSVRMRSTTNG